MKRLSLSIAAGFLMSVGAQAGRMPDRDEQQCLETSARLNSLPAPLLLAIRQQEGGRVGALHQNADGTFDYGVMQINSRWLPILAPRGYTAMQLTYSACASIAAGAWIMAQALAAHRVWNRADAEPLAYWRAVGGYHSQNPIRNRAYAEQVWSRYRSQPAGHRP